MKRMGRACAGAVLLFALLTPFLFQNHNPINSWNKASASEVTQMKRETDLTSRLIACKSNLKNMGTALEMYSTDNNGRYPVALSKITPDYLKVIPTCPAAKADTYSSSYVSHDKPDVYSIYCSGHHHKLVKLPPDYPKYDAIQGLIDEPGK